MLFRSGEWCGTRSRKSYALLQKMVASARAGTNVRSSEILIPSKEPALPNSAIAPLCALTGPRRSLRIVKCTVPSLQSLHSPYAAKPFISTSPWTLQIKFLVGTQQPTLDWVPFCHCFRKTLHLHSPHYLKLPPQHSRVNKCPPIHTEQTHLHSCNPLKLREINASRWPACSLPALPAIYSPRSK